MSGRPAAVSISRVVLTLRASGDVVRLLEDAAALARATRAELAGLFVEESDLLRVAALPITSEVGGTSGAVRSIELPATRLLLARRTAEVRRLVERAATELDVPWSFGVARGSVVEVAISAASAPGVVVLVPPTPTGVESAVGATAGTAPARRPRARPPVAAVVDGSPAGDRALDAALALAGGRPGDVAIVLPGGPGAAGLRNAAARRLGLTGSLPPVVELVAPARPLLRALVVAGEPGRALAELRRLRAVAGCPVVLVP